MTQPTIALEILAALAVLFAWLAAALASRPKPRVPILSPESRERRWTGDVRWADESWDPHGRRG